MVFEVKPSVISLRAFFFRFFRFRLAHRAIEFPLIQEAHMPSFRTTDTFIYRLLADRTYLHRELYHRNFRLHDQKHHHKGMKLIASLIILKKNTR
ncbi:MAG: hypothetical protein OEW69_00025 [Nitrospirota bacterium]|nr:hypothetical protein [Nitrospirota bacterium]